MTKYWTDNYEKPNLKAKWKIFINNCTNSLKENKKSVLLQVSWVIKFLIFFGCISVRRNRSRKARKSGNVVLSFYCCCFRWGVCLQEKYICFYSESETSYQSLHYMKPCLKIPNISRSTGNVYSRIIILNLVALWSFVLSK